MIAIPRIMVSRSHPTQRHARQGAWALGLLLTLSLAGCGTTGSGSPGVVRNVPGDQAVEAGIEPFLGPPHFESQQVFKGGRFPNVVVAMNGDVLATWGSDRLRVRRSADGGQTWGPEIVVLEHKGAVHGGGTIVDETTGDILMFSHAEHPPSDWQMYRSKDHGRTWAQRPTVVRRNQAGHLPAMHMNESGITLRYGQHKGRLITATRWYGLANYPKANWPTHYTNAMYSDDGGRTWQTSEPFPAFGTGEAAIAQRTDGSLYYNARRHWAPEGVDSLHRWTADSHDGGQTWQGLAVDATLPDGNQNAEYGLMGGLVRLPVAGRDIFIFSNIQSDTRREGGTVWVSFDGGRTWPAKRRITDGRFAYSSLAAGRPGTPSEGWIYLQYETGGHPDSASIIARFNLAWILQNQIVAE